MLPMPATSSTICIGSPYWRRNARQRGSVLASANLFGPYCWSRFAASAAVSPRAGSTPSRCATSSPLRVNQVGASVAATPSGSFTAPDGSITRS